MLAYSHETRTLTRSAQHPSLEHMFDSDDAHRYILAGGSYDQKKLHQSLRERAAEYGNTPTGAVPLCAVEQHLCTIMLRQ